MRPQMSQLGLPRMGRVLKILLVANVVAYVLELIAIRVGGGELVGELTLRPAEVFSGKVWQLFSYWWLHDPQNPTHLLWNMLMLWWSGTALEAAWGPRRFAWGYFWFGVGGALLTVAVGALSAAGLWPSLLGSFADKQHLGASGAVMGIVVAWGLTFSRQTFTFFLLGQVTGRTLVIIVLAFELLRALSLDPVSSTSHFGGIAAAFVMTRSLWRVGSVKELYKRWSLQRRRKSIERELRVIDGGKQEPAKKKIDPKDWN